VCICYNYPLAKQAGKVQEVETEAGGARVSAELCDLDLQNLRYEHLSLQSALKAHQSAPRTPVAPVKL
jgi:hypothetical protein